MSVRGRCQICGRLKGRRKDGGLAHHYVRGVPCRGIGHPPIEESDDALEAAIRSLREIARQRRGVIRALVEQRVNYIDPALERGVWAASDEADKLQRRLDRHRRWPARYRHQMMTLGYAMPPPAYLLARETTNEGARA